MFTGPDAHGRTLATTISTGETTGKGGKNPGGFWSALATAF